MYGNSVMTGMKVTAVAHRQTREVLHLALTVCFEAVAGTPMLPAAVLPFVITATRTAATTLLASASPAVQIDIHLCFELRNISI